MRTMPIAAVVAGSLALWAESALGQAADDPRVARLPQVGAVARTPMSNPTGAPSDLRDLVRFAAGSIEFRVPAGWRAAEEPVGREMRLVVAPPGSETRGGNLRDGLWVSYHVRARSPAAQEDLAALAHQRLRLWGITNVAPTEPARLGVVPAVRVRFEAADPANASVSPGAPEIRRGIHWLARTDWAFIEVHGTAPAATFAERLPEFDRLVHEMQISPPRLSWANVSVAPAAQAVAGIVGSWKAYRSRLWLGPDGRIVLRQDPGPASLDAAPAVKPPVAGRFEARDDLLQVTWDDGSRLNIRWKFDGEHLLLTDHEGQMTSLRRMLE